MRDLLSSFLVRVSLTLQRLLIKLEDIITELPVVQRAHIAANGATGSRGNSEAVVEHPVKKIGDRGLALERGKISLGRCYELLTTARREVWWRTVIVKATSQANARPKLETRNW